ncbi:cysteine peptidase family C39 domain-containing protein [Spiroplasma endosymbiont of Cleonymus obscurus]|uniref:cysteine peptidase family C39 domain-containing protein n=1 Tax=Spiroplasma endosymbiont of Cleonymus obscurus TaxID=3066324 RepID=UPI0037DC35A6
MKYPFVQQETENDCGLACLAMIYRFYFKKKLLINDIKKDIFLTKLGINLLELKQLASNYNLLLKAYNINFDKLKSLIIVKSLIIQIYNANVGFHFIVIYKKKKNKWLVANPEDIELSWKNIEDFKIFTNVVISTNIINKFLLVIKKRWIKLKIFHHFWFQIIYIIH